MTPEEEIDARILRAVDKFGRLGVALIKDNLSVSYPPSSKGGENPHRRTGNLRDGIVVLELAQAGPLTSITFAALATYAEFLQFGTEHMAARPFADIATPELTQLATDTLQAEFD